ncbi:MAG: Ldh family oxidoreductase [Thermoproteota archaeon]
MPVKKPEQLRTAAFQVFKKLGAPDWNADLVAKLLVKANLAGHDSHGIIRVPSYVERIRMKALDPRAGIRVAKDGGATLVVDGCWGFGQVAAWMAMERTVVNAGKSGACLTAVFNCNHVGRLADYSSIPLESSMIGFAMCNGPARVAPFGGAERLFNPSPLSVAIPALEEKPIVLDISTSVVAEGKLMVKRKRHEKVPEGWIVDKDGRATVDVEDYFEGGSILPLGGTVGYKGFGMALAIDALAGILTGTGSASSPDFKNGNGLILGAIDVSFFRDADGFKRDVDALIRRIRSSRKAPGFGEILIPGEPEAREEAKRMRDGIYVEEETWNDLLEVGTGLGIDVSSW